VSVRKTIGTINSILYHTITHSIHDANTCSHSASAELSFHFSDSSQPSILKKTFSCSCYTGIINVKSLLPILPLYYSIINCFKIPSKTPPNFLIFFNRNTDIF
jgi:hypothetical protein